MTDVPFLERATPDLQPLFKAAIKIVKAIILYLK
jgi:hypothetical protein